MCVFCQIVAGEIPARKVYEDDAVLSFLDIKPVHPGHLLIIPKVHISNLEEISDVDLCGLISVVKKLGAKVKEKLGYEGYNVIVNNDPLAGQIIPHLHFHIIPRLPDDGLNRWPESEYREGEQDEIVKKLIS
ncbi:MAG: HIT family protein [Bacillota bacterium]